MVPAALTGAAGVGSPGGLGMAAALEPLPPVAGGGGGGECTSARLGCGDLEGKSSTLLLPADQSLLLTTIYCLLQCYLLRSAYNVLLPMLTTYPALELKMIA